MHLTNWYGYFDYGGNPKTPNLSPHAGIKMAQILRSPVNIGPDMTFAFVWFYKTVVIVILLHYSCACFAAQKLIVMFAVLDCLCIFSAFLKLTQQWRHICSCCCSEAEYLQSSAKLWEHFQYKPCHAPCSPKSVLAVIVLLWINNTNMAWWRSEGENMQLWCITSKGRTSLHVSHFITMIMVNESHVLLFICGYLLLE